MLEIHRRRRVTPRCEASATGPSGFERRMAAPALLLLHDACRGIASSSRLGAAVRRLERGQIQFFSSLLKPARRAT